MLRRIAELVFAICLASWLMLGLLLCMTVVSQGWGGIGPKLIHVAGSTNNLGVQSVNLVVWRLAGLLAITVGAGYFWWSQRKHR